MGKVIEAMLRLDCAATVLAGRLGRGRSSEQVRAALRELRRETATLATGAMAAGLDREVDPVHAVRLVAEWALASGADWQAITATINNAATMRPRGE